MTGISPIPSTRISDQLIRSRMLSQMQFDQRELFRVQTQVSTGRRILLPSEDAPAALRAIGLQRLLERKEQVAVNLQTNQSYLSATDVALSSVSGILADLRGASLAVADTISNATQRQAVAAAVDRAIDQLIDTGNQNFRGRYLFAGTRTTTVPFARDGNYVSYAGNEGQLRSYSDIDVLFDSSVNGDQVFGALSQQVRGSTDLNPVVTADTLLTDLRGGQGIGSGSISVSDGTSSKIINLSSARTLGDVARLIETNPPAGRTVTVTVKPTGLNVAIDGGNLLIGEVAGGTTAGELGIRRESGAATQIISGADLNPTLTLTTKLDNILGARAYALVASPGLNNDLRLDANTNGADLNGVTVQFVNDALLHAAPALTAGNETAVYHDTAQPARASLKLTGVDNDLLLTANTPGVDFNNVNIVLVNAGDVKNNPTATYTDVAGVRTLTLGIDDTDETTLQDLVDAINNNTPFTASPDASNGEGYDPAASVLTADAGSVTGNTGNSGGAAKTLYVHISPGMTNANQALAAINAEGTFTATLDRHDRTTAAQAGLGVIDLNATGTSVGGSGTDFDRDSGLQIVNGGETFDISFASAETVEDLLNIINGAGAGALAEINAAGTGINLRSRLSGADFSIGENGGITASQLGVRSFTGDTELADLNAGNGVQIIDGVDFTITSNDGTELAIDLTGARTIDDVLAKINDHPDNAGRVVARLAAVGNGIELVDDNPSGLGADGQPLALTVRTTTLSQAAVNLGLVPVGQTESTPPTPATTPTATTQFAAANTNLTFTASQRGTALGDVQIVFQNTVVGDQAVVNYDSNTKTLTIDIDPTATRAVTIRDAVDLEGTFTAALDTEAGPNTGQGIVTELGLATTTSAGSPELLTGRNVHPEETEGVFNTLIRLKNALQTNDLPEIQRSLEMLDLDIERVNFARAEIGARQTGLDTLQTRLATEEVDLRGALSNEIEVDFAEAISEMTARQFAFQATLQTTAGMLQQTLLNYL